MKSTKIFPQKFPAVILCDLCTYFSFSLDSSISMKRMSTPSSALG